MTEHMDLGSKPNLVKRSPARYSQTIREAATHRLLADPIEFRKTWPGCSSRDCRMMC
jgi:hypothetical protein